METAGRGFSETLKASGIDQAAHCCVYHTHLYSCFFSTVFPVSPPGLFSHLRHRGHLLWLCVRLTHSGSPPFCVTFGDAALLPFMPLTCHLPACVCLPARRLRSSIGCTVSSSFRKYLLALIASQAVHQALGYCREREQLLPAHPDCRDRWRVPSSQIGSDSKY